MCVCVCVCVRVSCMQVASPKLKEVARHLSGLAISTAVQSPRGQPLTASVDAPSPAHDDAPASPMHDFLALSPSHADTRQWTQRLLAVASTVQELSGAAAAAATADASSPRAHAPPRVALPHDMRGDAAVTASYDADAAVLQVRWWAALFVPPKHTHTHTPRHTHAHTHTRKLLATRRVLQDAVRTSARHLVCLCVCVCVSM